MQRLQSTPLHAPPCPASLLHTALRPTPPACLPRPRRTLNVAKARGRLSELLAAAALEEGSLAAFGYVRDATQAASFFEFDSIDPAINDSVRNTTAKQPRGRLRPGLPALRSRPRRDSMHLPPFRPRRALKPGCPGPNPTCCLADGGGGGEGGGGPAGAAAAPRQPSGHARHQPQASEISPGMNPLDVLARRWPEHGGCGAGVAARRLQAPALTRVPPPCPVLPLLPPCPCPAACA